MIGRDGNDEQAAQLAGLFNGLALDPEASNRLRRFLEKGDTRALEQAGVDLGLSFYTATICRFLCTERRELIRRTVCRSLADRSPLENDSPVELMMPIRALIAAYKRQDAVRQKGGRTGAGTPARGGDERKTNQRGLAAEDPPPRPSVVACFASS